jgi:hypothetical protein
MSEYWTTIRLTERANDWTATQRGVNVTGVGEPAPRAAADYCAKVASKHEDTDEGMNGGSDRVTIEGTAR